MAVVRAGVSAALARSPAPRISRRRFRPLDQGRPHVVGQAIENAGGDQLLGAFLCILGGGELHLYVDLVGAVVRGRRVRVPSLPFVAFWLVRAKFERAAAAAKSANLRPRHDVPEAGARGGGANAFRKPIRPSQETPAWWIELAQNGPWALSGPAEPDGGQSDDLEPNRGLSPSPGCETRQRAIGTPAPRPEREPGHRGWRRSHPCGGVSVSRSDRLPRHGRGRSRRPPPAPRLRDPAAHTTLRASTGR
jgi:hypothetical protein